MKTFEDNKILAEKLLQIKAIKLNSQNPFTWASGWKSPIYCDNRKTLAYPEVRTYIAEQFSGMVKKYFPETEIIAGVATGGIAHGVLVADKTNLPFCYVRPKPKEHGLQNQIEGQLIPGQKVLVIEDLISTGKSSYQAIEAIQKAGGEILGMGAIFQYGFKEAGELFSQNGIKYFTLTDYNVLLQKAVEIGYVTNDSFELLKNWQADPANWGK